MMDECSRKFPLVSVIMPAYNSAKFVHEAVISVLQQTYENWELIIVDDGSTDRTRQIVQQLAEVDKRIRLVQHNQRRGVAAARNLALDLAKGKYIAFLDSDDKWKTEKLEVQVNFLQERSCSITYSAYLRISENGETLTKVTPPRAISYSDQLRTNHIALSTSVYEKRAFPLLRFKDVGNEDYLFWLEALSTEHATAHAAPSRIPLAEYRVLKKSLSSNKIKSLYWQWNIYRKILDIGVSRSLFYVMTHAVNGWRKRQKAIDNCNL